MAMSDRSSERQVVLTCAQPTGKLHLGNYLGAVRHWTRYLDDYECYFGIVDLHAITVPYIPGDLRSDTLECIAQYIACGLDPDKANIFIQSHIVGHTELAWILGCLCPLGQLERMTQFKDKAVKDQEARGFIGSGLLTYPVLMAADILLYNADIVPVGEDQKQHLELTRDLAQKFNSTYSETFKVPDVFIPETGARVMSLLALEAEFVGASYKEFKDAVADAVVELLAPIREKYESIKADKQFLTDVLRNGDAAAQKRAFKLLSKVQRKAGFVARE